MNSLKRFLIIVLMAGLAMIREIGQLFLIIALFYTTSYSQNHIELVLEDYDDQDLFNNFSGDWNKWNDSMGIGTFQLSFDTSIIPQDSGACLRVDYSVPQAGFGGVWNSLLGKIDFKNQYLDFTDLYDGLKNSADNPTEINNVQITKFSFLARGNGDGNFDHVVKVEFKDVSDMVTSKIFNIPNSTEWTRYEFAISEMKEVDLSKMKELVFVVSDFMNQFRSSHFFLDDLTFTTSEAFYDANQWDDKTFSDAVAQRAFHYFITFTDTLGFALDRSTFSDLVSVGAIGFQLTAYCIGDKNGWADDLEQRAEKVLRNLQALPMGSEPGTASAGYRGFFYHFFDANTGRRKNNTVELSLYDTMLLMYGVLTCKEYFSDNEDIQKMAQALYDSVQWNWMVDTSSGVNQHQFHLAWKPELENGFEGHVDGYTDEALLVDVLALGSTTYPITMETYNARSRIMDTYPEASPDSIAAAWTGSLFNYFFASCWLDLEKFKTDRYVQRPLNIWENNRRAIVAARQFCIQHQDNIIANGDDKYTTYGKNSWGLTACDNLVNPTSGFLSEYFAFGALPTQQNIQFPNTNAPHLGTIAVYGAGSSIMYTPNESIAALRHYYSNTSLWIPLFGFGDAYSTDPHYYDADPKTFEPILDSNGNLMIHPAPWLNGPWVNHMIMGINEGPMLIGIENHRTDMIWELTNANSTIQAGIDSIFDMPTSVEGHDLKQMPMEFELYTNYPNPFNPTTQISYALPQRTKVTLKIYNVLGQEVRKLVDEIQSRGLQVVIWDGKDNHDRSVGSGIYIYHIRTPFNEQSKKMLFLK